MKSAYELAMERLEKQSPSAKITEDQRSQLAEIDSLYKSKIAEKELLLADLIQKERAAGKPAEVDKLQLLELRYQVEKNVDTFYEYLYIFDLAACVDVQVGDMEIVFFYQKQDLVGLIDGDAEFAFVMPCADLEIAAGHDIGAEPHSYRVAMPIGLAKFFEIA